MNQENKTKLIIGVLFLGGLFLALTYYFPLFNKRSVDQDANLEIGQVEKLQGEVTIHRNGQTDKEVILSVSTLRTLDQIETGPYSSALIKLNSGNQIKIFPLSLVTPQSIQGDSENHIVLSVKQGSVFMAKLGIEGTLTISKNGEQIPASDYNESPLANAKTLSGSGSPLGSTELSDEEITATMNSHKNAFYKCYTRLLQKVPTARGTANLSITIEESGKVSRCEVNSNELTDSAFVACLKEASLRVQFRSYQGATITALFPINFE